MGKLERTQDFTQRREDDARQNEKHRKMQKNELPTNDSVRTTSN